MVKLEYKPNLLIAKISELVVLFPIFDLKRIDFLLRLKIGFYVLLEQLANACVGLVDKMLAGRLDATIARPALDGVGLASYVGWFTGVAMSAIGIGGMALIARAMPCTVSRWTTCTSSCVVRMSIQSSYASRTESDSGAVT